MEKLPDESLASFVPYVALNLLETATTETSPYLLNYYIRKHASLRPLDDIETSFADFLTTAHDTMLVLGHSKEAYGHAITLYHLGKQDAAEPLISISADVLGSEEFAKAKEAIKKNEFRRAADKGVWSALHLADAIRFGNKDSLKKFKLVSKFALRANAVYGGDTSAIEEPIFNEYLNLGLRPPYRFLHSLHVKAFEKAKNDTKPESYRAYTMLHHAHVLEKFGLNDGAYVLQAALTGINDFIDGIADNIYLNEFAEILLKSTNNSENSELKNFVIKAKREEYKRIIDYKYGHKAWSYAAQARVANDLIRLGDVGSKQKLFYSLSNEIKAIDKSYFTDGEYLALYWERFRDRGYLSNKKYIDLINLAKTKLQELQWELQYLGDWDEDYVLPVISRNIDQLENILSR